MIKKEKKRIKGNLQCAMIIPGLLSLKLFLFIVILISAIPIIEAKQGHLKLLAIKET